jgi:hypothetical protein
MSQNRTLEGAQRGAPGSGFEIRLSSALVCGISAVVLQTAALERAPFCAALVDGDGASSDTDPVGGGSGPFVATRRGQVLLGSAPLQGGTAAANVPPPDDLAIAGPPVRESALVAAALAACRHLAANPLRGPPRLTS